MLLSNTGKSAASGSRRDDRFVSRLLNEYAKKPRLSEGRGFFFRASSAYLPITRIWKEPGIIGGRGPRIKAGTPDGGGVAPAAGTGAAGVGNGGIVGRRPSTHGGAVFPSPVMKKVTSPPRIAGQLKLW